MKDEPKGRILLFAMSAVTMIGLMLLATVVTLLVRLAKGDWSQTWLIYSIFLIQGTGWVVAFYKLHQKSPSFIERLFRRDHEDDFGRRAKS